MARIRSIKPEFWTSAQVMECSPMARLLFIGMWNFADDAGRMTYSPKTLKAQIYPSDDITSADIEKLIVELSSNGLILIYSADGKEFISITGWSHQKIDKPRPSKLPDPFVETSPKPRRKVATDLSGSEGKGSEGIDKDRAVALVDDGWPSDYREQFWQQYPNKIGKPKALAKLDACRKRHIEFGAIMSGLDRYIRAKPPDRAWLNPETFINQERWTDQPAQVQQGNSTNGKRTVHDAARDLAARVQALDEPAPELCDETGRGFVRMLPAR
jgi:hypothetical protein